MPDAHDCEVCPCSTPGSTHCPCLHTQPDPTDTETLAEVRVCPICQNTPDECIHDEAEGLLALLEAQRHDTAERVERLIEHICWERFDCSREWAECDHGIARRLVEHIFPPAARIEQARAGEGVETVVRVGFRYQDGEVLGPEREALSRDEELPVVVLDLGDGEWLTLSEVRSRIDDEWIDDVLSPVEPETSEPEGGGSHG